MIKTTGDVTRDIRGNSMYPFYVQCTSAYMVHTYTILKRVEIISYIIFLAYSHMKQRMYLHVKLYTPVIVAEFKRHIT